jgi:uncharacterized protein
MVASGDMKVLLVDLPVHKSITLANAFVRDTIAELPLREALEAPADDSGAGEGSAELDLYSDEENAFVRGKLQGWLVVACSRCVGPARVEVDDELMVTYMPKERQPEDDEEEVELAEDDLDVYVYTDNEIDLAPLLRERLIMSVPYAPLCREDCKGLCPQCGVDRNHETCSCEAPIDPRLAALKDIKLKA